MGAIDLAHAAAAQQLQDPVRAEHRLIHWPPIFPRRDRTPVPAWSTAANILAGITAALAETGNNILRADADSVAGGPPPTDLLPTAAAPVPIPAAPPPAAGTNGAGSDGDLAPYWPAADPERLRAAESGWRTAAADIRGIGGSAVAAVAALSDANPNPTLAEVRDFVTAHLAPDRDPSLFAALATVCGRLAAACRLLALITDRTREATCVTSSST